MNPLIRIYIAVAPFLMLLLFIDLGNDDNYRELYKNCKVLEVNHYNGFFSSNTNKLDCDGVIYNVDAKQYNEAFKPYEIDKNEYEIKIE